MDMVGGWDLPLWKIWVRQLGWLFMIIPNIWENKSHVPVTTNILQVSPMLPSRGQHDLGKTGWLSAWKKNTCSGCLSAPHVFPRTGIRDGREKSDCDNSSSFTWLGKIFSLSPRMLFLEKKKQQEIGGDGWEILDIRTWISVEDFGRSWAHNWDSTIESSIN